MLLLPKTQIILSIANTNIIVVLQILKTNLLVFVSGIYDKAFKIENAEKINAIEINIIENQL